MQSVEKDYTIYLHKKLGIDYKIINHECESQTFLNIVERLGGVSDEQL